MIDITPDIDDSPLDARYKLATETTYAILEVLSDGRLALYWRAPTSFDDFCDAVKTDENMSLDTSRQEVRPPTNTLTIHEIAQLSPSERQTAFGLLAIESSEQTYEVSWEPLEGPNNELTILLGQPGTVSILDLIEAHAPSAWSEQTRAKLVSSITDVLA